MTKRVQRAMRGSNQIPLEGGSEHDVHQRFLTAPPANRFAATSGLGGHLLAVFAHLVTDAPRHWSQPDYGADGDECDDCVLHHCLPSPSRGAVSGASSWAPFA